MNDKRGVLSLMHGTVAEHGAGAVIDDRLASTATTRPLAAVGAVTSGVTRAALVKLCTDDRPDDFVTTTIHSSAASGRSAVGVCCNPLRPACDNTTAAPTMRRTINW